MNVQPFQIVAIIVWGVLAVCGLFTYGMWRGAELGTLAAVGTAAATWAFQQADYQANGAAVTGFLFALSVALGFTSAILSYIGV
ncbi:MAG: hypothetical protein WCY29_06045 [Novosphingobium sp.]